MVSLRPKSITRQFVIASVLIVAIAGACLAFRAYLSYHAVGMLLLLGVSVIATRYDIYPVLAAATLSALMLNFFFIPPLYTFHINTGEDLLMLLIYFIIAVLNTIFTFRIKQEERKNHERAERRNAIRLYNTLFNSLSHELKTPITTVMAAADTLADERINNDTARMLAGEIQVAAQRLNSQVENLLAMSRLESGMLRLQKDWCDITDMLYTIARQQPSTHTVEVKTADSLPLIKIDAGLVVQIVENIVRNATNYTLPGTIVTITADYTDGACIITVADDGPGLPADALEQVFEKFYRGNGSKAGGTGLGLSIAKGFAEAHGGNVKAENNNGAVFTVTLPAESTYINRLKNE